MKLFAENIAITKGKKTICSSLQLALAAGDFLGILGPNGCGKTSLLQTLAGIHPTSSGQIWLDGQELSELSAAAIAKHIAILFQDTHFIFPQTVFEYCLTARYPHLSFFKRESEHDMELVIDALTATDLIQFKHQPVTMLSGGEKRRLSIAAVLAQTPDIFLLDEPINHLDVRHQIKILHHFHHLITADSKALAVTLHDMNMAQQFCNRILLLFQDGSIIQGTPQEVMTTENLSRLYHHPVKKISNGEITLWWPVEN